MNSTPAVARFALPLLALLGACAPIHYTVQEIVVRPDAKADALDVLILYGGIQTAPQDRVDALDVANRFAARVVLGAREFMLVDWPGHCDLDEVEKRARAAPADPSDRWTGWRRDGIDCLEKVRVVASGFYADEQQHVSMYQRFRIASAEKLVDLANRSLHLWIEDRIADGKLEEATPLLDDETRAAWKKLAAQKTGWIAIRNGGIELDLPMSGATAARIAADWMRESIRAPEARQGFAALFGSLEDVRFLDDRVHARWGAANGPIRFRIEGTRGYDEGFAKDLRAAPEFPEHLPSVEDVIGIFLRS